MDIIKIIEHKRDKKVLSTEEINFFVKEYTAGNITDYQASALIMAIYINGMNKKEISDLTIAMADSGERINLSDISENIVDKHSTGGVGDKITLVLMPIIASLGVPVAKMSGRGLGYTGGTADKLESIPGYRVDLGIDEFKQNIKDIGISLITSNVDLAPADSKIYGLRHSIACTSNIPLIASSIMSKKIALGANKVLINITCGDGAFMKKMSDAKKIANIMKEIGKEANREVRCVITSMAEPVGYTIGNQIEIIETIKCLKGEMPDDVRQIIYALGSQMLIMAGKIKTANEAKQLIDETIKSGKALKKFEELIQRQGGDVSYIQDITKFKPSKYVIPVLSDKEGMVNKIQTEMLGNLSAYVGAGRNKKEDKIDYTAGIVLTKKIGDIVRSGETIAYVHTNKEETVNSVVKNVKDAFTISQRKTSKPNVVLGTII